MQNYDLYDCFDGLWATIVLTSEVQVVLCDGVAPSQVILYIPQVKDELSRRSYSPSMMRIPITPNATL